MAAAAPGSVRSHAIVDTSFWRAARLSDGAPGRTVPTTSAPSRRASSARWLPAKPAMPVIKTFTAPCLDALAPVLEEILERHLERNRGLPARGALEFRAVAQEERDVRRPHARGVLPDLDLHVGQAEEDVQHLLRGVAATRADVVDLSRLPALEGQPVRAHHVADVGEVADRLEIAHVDDGLAEALL